MYGTNVRLLFLFLLLLPARLFSQVTISSVTSASGATNATITWTTNIPATSRLLYGTSYSNLSSATPIDYTLVTSHTVNLTDLPTGPRYFFAAVSMDSLGNSSQSSTFGLALCGQPSIGVSGTINNYYGYGTYTVTYTPPSDAGATPTVCGTPIATSTTGDLSYASSMSTTLPLWGRWTTTISDVGHIGTVSVPSLVIDTSNDISAQLQAAAAPIGLTFAWANNINQTCYPAFMCSGGDFAPYPPAGIPRSTGTAWASSYGVSGTGSTVALTSGPAFTSATFGSSGQMLVDTSGNLAIGYTGSLPIPWPLTLGTTGQFHSDAAGNVRASTFNGIALATGGPTTSYLGQDGSYHALPANSNGFPITIGNTSIAANGSTNILQGLNQVQLAGPIANADQNFNSGSLALTASFYDIGATPQTWVVEQIIGAGNTPNSTFYIAPIPGGTTGSRIFEVSADEEILENGAGIVHVTGNSTYMGVGTTGVSVGPSNVTISGATSAGNVLLNAGATGLVIANRPIQMPVASFVNGGSTINLNAPAGGSGIFNQNVTAENGDLQPCPTGTPTVVPGAAAGANATASVIGTNCAGVVTLTTGGSPISQDSIFTLTFSNPFTHYGFCTFSPTPVTLQDPGITTNNVGIWSGYNDHFQLVMVGGEAKMSPLSNHQWSYTCNGY